MRILHFDPFSGISGDMTVGALIDAGALKDELFAILDSLATEATFEVEQVKRRGIAASKFHVRAAETKKHRHLTHIIDMLQASRMPAKALRNAIAVFERLGAAEAGVHGVPIEKVHFHEVGAVDSICDIAGACIGLELLEIDEVHCSPVNTGSGTVNTEHGVLPVPAPATAKLLEGSPVYARGPAMELTTPTGAAIASTLAARFGSLAPMRLERTGYGAGDRDFTEHANVLRVTIGESAAVTEALTVAVIEANIDDSTPEVLGYAMDRLLAAGALDVSFSAIQMKKNRPGTLVRVIANPEDRESLAGLIFSETSSFGLRIYAAERRVESRRHVEADLGYGKVRVKLSAGGTVSPEFEDCRRVAEQTGKPLKDVMADAVRAVAS